MKLSSCIFAFGVVVGCSSGPAKEDVGDAPFDLDQLDAKEDSPTRPTKGADARVAEQIVDTFSSSRGFIAHQIHLTGGRVDLDVSGLEGSDQLDTILYVYGPKKANGKYSTPAIAFNDDFEPGINLGSHLVLDVPRDGDYLIVVSSYENYIYHPTHPSRGEYRLMVKCQSESFGACGPAVSGEGGQCWADADCVAADDSPLHCEGEVVCAPGTQCLFTRIGTCVEDYAWMTIAPKQCTNPWSQTPVDAAEAEAFLADLAQVKKHYGTKGVTFDELGQLTRAEPLATCQACGCARGDKLLVKVKSDQASALAADGWVFSAPAPEAVSIAPKQCGSNPWETSPTTLVEEELEQVDTYFAAELANVPTRGFTFPAEPKATCSSCACARGDRLVAFPADQESAGILSALGFSAIYVR